MKHVFIVNPTSGQGATKDFVEKEISAKFKEKNLDFEIYYTTGPGDGKQYVEKLASASNDEIRFYACGGDGTLYEVVNGAYKYKNSQVAIIPLGSGNDFARFFGEQDKFLDLDAQINANVIDIDLINCGDDVSINVASMGFCAESCSVQGKMKKIPLVEGHLSYVLGGFYCCLKYVKNQFEVIVDDNIIYKGPFIFVVAGNARFYGSGIRVAPFAIPTDGMLDFVIMDRRVNWFRTFSDMMGKWQKNFTHIYLPYSHYVRGKKITIKSKEIRHVNVDGECRPVNEVTMEVMEKALKFCIPTTISYNDDLLSGKISNEIDPKATK